jgi:hypothetical protein
MTLINSIYGNAQYVGYIAAWYAYGTTNIETLQKRSHQCGRFVSTRVAAVVPGWDLIVEPMIVSQLARIFVCMHHFIQGLTSDNTNIVDIEKAMTDMKKTILDDFAIDT